MAEFYTSCTKREISCQISNLLNMYNRWYTNFSAEMIEISPAYYFVELIQDKVVGCASSLKISEHLVKIQHVCVLPKYRNCGIASKLIKRTIDNCQIGHIFMTIRADNIASINMAQKLNFIYENKHWFRDHWTFTFGRRK